MASEYVNSTYGNISVENKTKILLKGHVMYLHDTKSSTKLLIKTANKAILCTDNANLALDDCFRLNVRRTIEGYDKLRKNFNREPGKLKQFLSEPVPIDLGSTTSTLSPKTTNAMSPKQYLPLINQSPILKNNHDYLQMNIQSPLVSESSNTFETYPKPALHSTPHASSSSLKVLKNDCPNCLLNRDRLASANDKSSRFRKELFKQNMTPKNYQRDLQR